MPLGSFRLNSLAKKLVTIPAGWGGWDGTKDGSYANMGLNTLVNFLPINDNRGVLVGREGFYNLSKSGTTITLGSTVGTATTTQGNDSPGGYAISDSTGTTGYFFNPRTSDTFYKFSSMGSSGVGSYGSGTLTLSGYNGGAGAAKVRSDGKIIFFGTRFNGSGNVLCRYIITVTGTSGSLSVSATFTDLGTTVQYYEIQAIAIVDDNTAVCIAGTSGSMKAYKLDSTVTQIGSTYATAFTVSRSYEADVMDRYEQSHMDHGYALAMVKNSSNQLVFLKATTAGFTNFTVSNPTVGGTHPTAGAQWGMVSLDTDYVMIKLSKASYTGSASDTELILVNATTGSVIRSAADGTYEEVARNFIKPWGANQLFLNNWQSVKVVKIV